MSAKELPMELEQKVRAGCFTKRNVLPMFTGLLLIAAVIGVSTVGVAIEDRNTDSYIAAPAVNDIYVVDFDKVVYWSKSRSSNAAWGPGELAHREDLNAHSSSLKALEMGDHSFVLSPRSMGIEFL